jgi:hypothetical protein
MNKWGLLEVDSCSHSTVQCVDYVNTESPLSYADAWVVTGAKLCRKQQGPPPSFDHVHSAYPATLVFVAGPNAGATPCAHVCLGLICDRMSIAAAVTDCVLASSVGMCRLFPQ